MIERNKIKKITALLGVLILVSGLMLASCGKAEQKDNGEVADSIQADLNGDGKDDEIVLSGRKQENGDPYMHQITLVVTDGKTGKTASASIGSNDVGYDPKLAVGSFTGEDEKELLISMATGGSGGIMIYSLLNYRDGEINTVVSQDELNKGLVLKTACLPGFLLSLTDQSTGYTVDIDLAKGIDDYIAMEFYDASGQLLKEPMVLVDGYSLMEVQDTNGDGIDELLGIQAISVGAHVNQVALARSVWSAKNGSLKLIEELIEPVDQ